MELNLKTLKLDGTVQGSLYNFNVFSKIFNIVSTTVALQGPIHTCRANKDLYE